METIEEFRALINGTLKECVKCKVIQDTMKDFYVGNGNVCKSCKKKVEADRKPSLYGLTEIKLKQMLTEQDNKCAICEVEFKVFITKKGYKRVSYHIDHDHDCCIGKGSCGKCVRGLLCNACNTGLGMYLRLMAHKEALDGYLSREYSK